MLLALILTNVCGSTDTIGRVHLSDGSMLPLVRSVDVVAPDAVAQLPAGCGSDSYCGLWCRTPGMGFPRASRGEDVSVYDRPWVTAWWWMRSSSSLDLHGGVAAGERRASFARRGHLTLASIGCGSHSRRNDMLTAVLLAGLTAGADTTITRIDQSRGLFSRRTSTTVFQQSSGGFGGVSSAAFIQSNTSRGFGGGFRSSVPIRQNFAAVQFNTGHAIHAPRQATFFAPSPFAAPSYGVTYAARQRVFFAAPAPTYTYAPASVLAAPGACDYGVGGGTASFAAQSYSCAPVAAPLAAPLRLDSGPRRITITIDAP